MYSPVTIRILPVLLFSTILGSGKPLSAQSYDTDSSWYYSNLIQDYLEADKVALVKVGTTQIEDTSGIYTTQKVSYYPVRVFKGAAYENNEFYAWVENKEVVWQEGSVRGFFLKGSAATARGSTDKNEKTHLYWLENSGFSEKDLSFIASLADTPQLKKEIAASWSGDLPGTWIMAKIVHPPSPVKSAYGPSSEITIELEDDSELPGLVKGEHILVTVLPSHFYEPEGSLSGLREGKSYAIFIFSTGSGWGTKEVFIFE